MDIKGERDEEEAASTAPSLLIVHREGDDLYDPYNHQCLYNVFESTGRFYDFKLDIPMLNGRRVIGSNHGYLVLLGVEPDDQYCCLWNPMTMEEIRLPTLEYHSSYHTCVLTKPPMEVGCRILLNTNDGYELAYCTIGDDTFKTHPLEWSDVRRMRLGAMCSFKGRIYGFVEGKNDEHEWYAHLVSIDFDGERLQLNSIFVVGDTLSAWSRPWDHTVSRGDYMVADGVDRLLLVRKMQPTWNLGRGDFRVFRVDPERMECVEVESIGDRTLFLSTLFGDSFCCVSSFNKTNPNSIYYKSNAEVTSRSIYVFNMDDGRNTALLPSTTVPRFACKFSWIHQQLAKHLLKSYYIGIN